MAAPLAWLVIVMLASPPDWLRVTMVERAGFEPAYACAGRFTVCRAMAEKNRHSYSYIAGSLGRVALQEALCNGRS